MRKQELHPRTAVINKNQKNKSKKARTEALSWLALNFPVAFDNSLQISPLKKGIMNDILNCADEAEKAGISKSKLREAVVLYTRRLDYLACLKSREMRIDLQGNMITEVTEEEAEQAATKIKKRVEKSIRNTRKMGTGQNSNQQNHYVANNVGSMHKTANQLPSMSDDFPIYPPRNSVYGTPNAQQPSKASTTIVKHKAAKQYDPDAVARLKEKLGLSRAVEQKKESVE
jgi:ProP effector